VNGVWWWATLAFAPWRGPNAETKWLAERGLPNAPTDPEQHFDGINRYAAKAHSAPIWPLQTEDA